MTARIHTRIAVALVVATAVAGLAACGDGAAAPAATSTTAPTPAGIDTAATYPVTVTDDRGEVTLEAQPRRIVSLSASLTEVLYAVGAGEQVIAVDRYSNHPAEAPVTELSGFRPNVEAIAAHEPDLVLVSSDRDGIVDALDTAGLPAALLTSADTLDDTYRVIEVVGALTGHGDQAASVVADVQARIGELVATVPQRDEPVPYYYELSGDLHSITSRTYVGELLALAGLRSIADAAPGDAGGYPQLNAEFVLGADPPVIFLARTDGAPVGPGDIAGRPGWGELAAVRSGNVVTLDTDLASRWGPRVVDLLEQVISATSGIR